MDRLDARAIVLPGVEVRVLGRCTSTNDLLLAEAPARPVLLAAEEQTAGRGRRGRRWYAAPGAALTFSLCRTIRRPLRELPGLALAAGVAVVRALRALGVRRAALKWPNDLVVDDAKLGGILVETRSRGGGALVVIGVGINCRRDAGLELRLRRRIAALERYIELPARNALAARLGAELVAALELFEARGLEPLRREWERLDAHAGRRLRVRLADGRVVSGVARGLAEDGGLRLATRAGVRAVRSGRVVSSRPA
jgi:BirA family transcriptional regulator, biotin operon repressor / biotin---[acetyl-CoA-carboxylase] ligase